MTDDNLGDYGLVRSISRHDGLDNILSPNGPHHRYYVVEDDDDETRHGPYFTTCEAEAAARSKEATITDHNGRIIDPD